VTVATHGALIVSMVGVIAALAAALMLLGLARRGDPRDEGRREPDR